MSILLVAGASSEIARQTVLSIDRKIFSEIWLLGRKEDLLHLLSQELQEAKGWKVRVFVLDLVNHVQVTEFFDSILSEDPPVQSLIAWGRLISNKDKIEQTLDPRAFSEVLRDNFTSQCDFVLRLAQNILKRGGGRPHYISIISSVAGDRGRGSLFAYSTAKSALTGFSSALRSLLNDSKIYIQTISPGPVATPMTKGIEKLPFLADASAVGKAIASKLGTQTDVVYCPWFWRWIMLIVRSIPECIYKRLKI